MSPSLIPNDGLSLCSFILSPPRNLLLLSLFKRQLGVCLTLQREQFPRGAGCVCRWGLILQVRRHHPCGKSMQSLLVAVTLKRPYAGNSLYGMCVSVCVYVCVLERSRRRNKVYLCDAKLVLGLTT